MNYPGDLYRELGQPAPTAAGHGSPIISSDRIWTPAMKGLMVVLALAALAVPASKLARSAVGELRTRMEAEERQRDAAVQAMETHLADAVTAGLSIEATEAMLRDRTTVLRNSIESSWVARINTIDDKVTTVRFEFSYPGGTKRHCRETGPDGNMQQGGSCQFNNGVSPSSRERLFVIRASHTTERTPTAPEPQ